jgi:hypothetical protein
MNSTEHRVLLACLVGVQSPLSACLNANNAALSTFPQSHPHTHRHTQRTQNFGVGTGWEKTLGVTIDRFGSSCALLPSNINPIVGTIQFRKRSVSLRLFSFASPHQLFVPVSAGTGQGESIAKIRTKLGDTS